MTKTKKLLLLLIWCIGRCLEVAAQPDEKDDLPQIQLAFSAPAGFYRMPVALQFTASPGSRIYYTTDGSKPNTSSAQIFTGNPIVLEQTTVVRAVAVHGSLKSPVITQTYFIHEPASRLPIVSVAIAPDILFDPVSGIMKPGPKADMELPHMPGANFWTRKEFVCNVEIFESNRQCVHNSPAGLRIFGGYSRIFPQKSIVLIARKKYGKKHFKHKIFGKNDYKKHKYLVLRNGGSDAQGAHFRDELMCALTENWDIEKQDYRTALLFLNGKYWGIYHIREKINGRFIQDHTDVDKDSIDLLEHRQTVREGSFRRYAQLLKFIENNDLAHPDHYNYVQQEIDISNFIDYQIAQIYCANTDGGGNVRYWRARRPGGRWRWILFDTDWGFGLHNPEAWKHNTLDFFTSPHGAEWPNPPWSTFLLRNLLKNEQFRQQFAVRMCDRLNTSFSTENVLQKIAAFEKCLAPEMPRHLKRWNLRASDWQYHLSVMKNFAQKRPDFLRQTFARTFRLGEEALLEILPAAGGHVLVNQVLHTSDTIFRGRYFAALPITLHAMPQFGYRFVGWEGIETNQKQVKIFLRAGGVLRLRPKFVPATHPLHDQIFFNEICTYNTTTGDWVEIFNRSQQAVSLEGWALCDAKHTFIFHNVVLPPQQYLVCCQDSAAFRARFPDVKNVVGNLPFGLHRAGERLALFATDGATVDTVRYRVEPPDEHFTIELLFQHFDNAQPLNWHTRIGDGSPGEANPLYMAQILSARKDFWTRVGLGIALALVALLALFFKRF